MKIFVPYCQIKSFSQQWGSLDNGNQLLIMLVFYIRLLAKIF